jgi:hypothetical protein
MFRLKLWIAAIAVVLTGGVASAQTLVPTSTISTATGTNCSVATTCVIAQDLRGVPSVGVYLNVGSSGTFNWEASIEEDVWFAVNDDVNAASSATADGAFFFSNPGYRKFRVRASAISGAATVRIERGFSGLRSTASLSGSAQGDGAIQDGASSSVEATVFDLTNANPLAAQIVDANGDAITSFGGGTQYTEGDTDASITGTALLWEAASNTLSTVTAGTPLPVTVITGFLTTTAHDAAFGTAGSADSQVRSVQGIASMVPLQVQSNGADLATQTTLAAVLTSANFAAAFGTAGSSDTQVLSVQGIASGTPLTVEGAISCSNCSGSGASFVDDAPFTAASDSGAPMMGYVTSDSVNSGDVGVVAMLANRQLKITWFDSSGNEVTPASGGTAIADDADFTAGTTAGTPIIGFYQSTVTACTDGDACVAGITAQRAMKVTLFSEAGAALTPSADHAEDDAFANADTGPMTLAVRDDTLGAHSGADGDFEPLHTNANGALWVQDVNIGTIFGTDAIFGTAGTADADVLSVQGIASMTPLLVNPGTAANFGVYVEDAGETAGGNLLMAGTVRRDTAASSAGTAADNATFNTDASGLLWTRAMDPCTANNTTTVPISVAADTAVIAAGGGSTRTYICGGVLVASAAEVVNLWEGTGTACGTSSAALAGSTTEANGMSLAANGGFEVSRTIRGIGTNVDVCIRLSATNRVAGWLSYVQVAQ